MLTMVNAMLIYVFKELEEDFEAVKGMIDNCIKTAKQFYDKISQEDDIDDDRGQSSDEDAQDTDDNAKISGNFPEDIAVHQVGVLTRSIRVTLTMF